MARTTYIEDPGPLIIVQLRSEVDESGRLGCLDDELRRTADETLLIVAAAAPLGEDAEKRIRLRLALFQPRIVVVLSSTSTPLVFSA